MTTDLSTLIRALTRDEAALAAQVHRQALDARLPWLAGLHTAEEDRGFYRDHLHPRCRMLGLFEAGRLQGVIVFADGWIEQLHVLPAAQGRGFGSSLLEVAQRQCDALQLWTFQRNLPARRFYENRGFVVLRETDGAENEEREPDVLYQWRRQSGAG